jgi:hypothetical protein
LSWFHVRRSALLRHGRLVYPPPPPMRTTATLPQA